MLSLKAFYYMAWKFNAEKKTKLNAVEMNALCGLCEISKSTELLKFMY